MKVGPSLYCTAFSLLARIISFYSFVITVPINGSISPVSVSI
nr:MAG TPA: hypothetical protein [Caudoviricetes sp.]